MKTMIYTAVVLALPWFFVQDTFVSSTAPLLVMEVCANGIDDDGDGLIDCFDPDCCGDCPDFYVDPCIANEPDCSASNAASSLMLQEAWSYGFDWHNYSTPLVGDIDGDGTVEIIGKRGPFQDFSTHHKDFLVINGEDGTLQEIIPSVYMGNTTDGPAMADVDHDGYAEIFVQASNSTLNANPRHIFCYKNTGSGYFLAWMSDVPASYDNNFSMLNIGIADFNNDGRPELYALNYIFDSITGQKIAEGGADNHMGKTASSFHKATPTAADVLADSDCTNCEGLELICGGQVYAVDIDVSSLTGALDVVREADFDIDGYTSIADVDLDGDLDAVVSYSGAGMANIYIWDMQTSSTLQTPFSMPAFDNDVSMATLGNLGGDDHPEIAVVTNNLLQVLSVESGNLSAVWSAVVDEPSGQSRCTFFDFNYDGVQELIYRDQQYLRVYNGQNGEIVFQVPCGGFTGWEVPTVSDIDQDEEAELLCSCDNELTAFESGSFNWAKTRPVWNQHNYMITNINDDLTVPVQQQQHQLVPAPANMNVYNVQYSHPFFPLPDLEIETADLICENSFLLLTMEWCNYGSAEVTDSIPVSIYTQNETAAAYTFFIHSQANINDCEAINVPLPTGFALEDTTVLVVIGDLGEHLPPFDISTDFPLSSTEECAYGNNIFEIDVSAFFLPPPNLGADITLCPGESLTLALDETYANYSWQDGSTADSLVINAAGQYWVVVSDDCINPLADTINVSWSYAPDISIGMDTILCPDQSLTLSAPGFVEYNWISSTSENPISNATTLVVSFPESDTIMLSATSTDGCVFQDTIMVTIVNEEPLMDTISLCGNEVIELPGGLVIDAAGTYQQLLEGDSCEVLNIIEVIAVDTSLTYEQLELCAGDTITLFGEPVFEGGIYSEVFTGFAGCDSTHQVEVSLLEISTTFEEVNICPGDTITYNGSLLSEPGVYDFSFQGINACDSVHQITIAWFEAPEFDVELIPSCDSMPIGQIRAQLSGAHGPYISFFEGAWLSTADTFIIEALMPGYYQFDIMDTNNCVFHDQVEIGNINSSSYETMVTDVSCSGFSDGSFQITGANTGALFVFNNEIGNENTYTNLPEGEYDITILDPSGCETTVDVLISAPSDLLITLPEYLTASLGCPIELPATAFYDREVSFSWDPEEGLSCIDCLRPEALVYSDELYTVVIQDSVGCQDSAFVLLTIDTDYQVYIPNAFSPNNDGRNDLFTVYTGKDVAQIMGIQIYDRWGELVYEETAIASTGQPKGWDGTFRGEDMKPGVFVYVIEVLFLDGAIRTYTGDASLVR